MNAVVDKFMDEFYDYIWGFGKTAQFLKNKEIITYHRNKIKLGLPTSYVNSAFTFTRTFMLRNLEENFVNKEQHLKEIQAIKKMIDINLDSLTSSYRE